MTPKERTEKVLGRATLRERGRSPRKDGAGMPSGSKRPVLFAMYARTRPRVGLLRAMALSRRLGAPLIVAICLPEVARINALFPQRNAIEATDRLKREDSLVRRAWRWCDKNLLEPLTEDRLVVAHGDLPGNAARTAADLKAQLVVVSDLDISTGREVAFIVDNAHTSVLLARGTRPRNAVIAATDMSMKRFTVLREGAAVAEMIGAPLTVMHNVEPRVYATAAVAGDGTVFLPMTGSIDPEQVAVRAEALAGVAEELEASEHHVATEIDTVDAILNLAKRQKADLVVVGHRRRSWLKRLFGASVATEVVDRSVRSVIVVPLARSGSEDGEKGARS
jgi:nucleotide-binding universal stress UspA family protein